MLILRVKELNSNEFDEMDDSRINHVKDFNSNEFDGMTD